MKKSKFYPEAKLMIECLPFIAEFPDFALKGGTALNFFVRNMPRLSVDIDLAYLPIRNCSPLGDRLRCRPHRFPPAYGKVRLQSLFVLRRHLFSPPRFEQLPCSERRVS